MLIGEAVGNLPTLDMEASRKISPELQSLLNRVIHRVVRRLERDGLLIADPEQPWLDLDFHEPLDLVRAASVRYRIAIGPHSGNRTLTLHDPSCIKTDKSPKPLTVDRDGFSLNAAVSCKPYQRERLERLCRYITRPAICLDRLNVKNDDQIQYELKNPFRNGATHILFSPLDFLSKLAALIPRPRHHLVRYHGIFAPNARIRKRIVPTKGKKTKTSKKSDKGEYKAETVAKVDDALIAPLSWAHLSSRLNTKDCLVIKSV